MARLAPRKLPSFKQASRATQSRVEEDEQWTWFLFGSSGTLVASFLPWFLLLQKKASDFTLLRVVCRHQVFKCSYRYHRN